MSSEPRPPTLARVAQLAGVSISTASLAFSGAGPVATTTRERVMRAAAELGYRGPNPLGRQLRSGRTGIVGVVIGDQLRRAFRDPVSVQVLDGLTSMLGSHGLGVLLIPGVPALPTSDAVDPLVESAAMDVAVMVWGVGHQDATLAALHRRGVPVVIGEGVHTDGCPLVEVRDRSGIADAVRHLRALGHTRIAEITLPLDASGRSGPLDDDRVAQAQRTPATHRLAGVRDVIVPAFSWETPASLVEHGHDAAMEILGDWVPYEERPTAIIAHSDLLAAGAIIGARELDLRVPEDVSVVGFDGLDLPWLSPDVLTSVHQPLAEKGAALGQAAVDLLAGAEPGITTLDVVLIPGTTSGLAPTEIRAATRS